MSHHLAAVPAAVTSLNVFVAIRNDLQRYGIEGMLRSLDLVARCRAYPGVADAADALRDPRTDILLTTSHAMDHVEQTALRHAIHDGVRVLLLVPAPGDPHGPAVITAPPGASLLLMDELNTATLRTALTAMDAGEVHIPPGAHRALLHRAQLGGPGSQPGVTPRLTPRERQTLTLLVEGFSNKQIARRLRISEHGAKRLVASILAKLNCPNRTLAVARALREGLCEDPASARSPRA